jgi:hypothetical protein
MIERSLIFFNPSRELLLFNLDKFLEFFKKQFHFKLHLNPEVVQSVVKLFVEQNALFKVELNQLWLTAADCPFVDELDRLGLVSNDGGHPLYRVTERPDGPFVGMLRPPSRVIEAKSAEDGVLLTGEVSADVGGFFLAMDEAGDCTGHKWVLVEHGDLGY